MNAQELVKSQIAFAHQTFRGIMQDVNEAIAASVPAGNIQPIGPIAAHCVLSEDYFMSVAMGGSPIYQLEGWRAKIGAPEADNTRLTHDVAAGTTLNLEAFNEYATKVFASTEGWLENADADALARIVDTPFGQMPALALAGGLVLYHISEHSGEIAAIKGIQDLKGLPF